MTEYDLLRQSYRALLASADNAVQALEQMAERLSADLPANVVIADSRGCIAAQARLEYFNPFGREKGEMLDTVLADSLAELDSDLTDVPMDRLPVRTAAKSDIRQYTASIFAAKVYRSRACSLIVYRREAPLDDDEKALCAFVSCAAALILSSRDNEQRLNEKRKREIIKTVTESLSYSELMVSGIIFRYLGSNEGIIVASRIADSEGITRSVIVNAIRKLESAGILESRSLGMKGTYIKVLNDYFASEIAKIKK